MAGIRRDLGKIVKRCLIKDPERRYQTAKDLRNELEEAKQEVTSGEAFVGTAAPTKATSWSKSLWAAGVVIALLAAGWLATRGPSDEGTIRLVNPVQVTTAVGIEDFPSWSPDGRTLAYESDDSGNWDIWVKQVGSGQPVNRTADHSGEDDFPSWSPDGSEIAFRSYRDGARGIFVMPALAGAPRRVATGIISNGAPQWSADGTKLAYSLRDGEENLMEILTLRGGEIQRIPLPGKTLGRLELAWSSHERLVAYLDIDGGGYETQRLVAFSVSDGEAFEVTDGRTKVSSPFWAPDGRTLYYVSNHGGSMDLWGQPMGEDGTPVGEPMPLTAGVVIRSATLSHDGTKLAYSKGRRVANLWRVPILPDRPATWDDAEQLTFDQAEISGVDVSPNGQILLLESDRRGNQDVWTMPVEGGEMQQLTTEPTPDWAPVWSPNGRDVAFYSERSGNRDIWVMPASGGAARQVTTDESQDYQPAWSPDGRELVFASRRVGGTRALWVVPVEGGEPRRLTNSTGRDWEAKWSPDGRWLAFNRNWPGMGNEVWRVPAAGGEAELLAEGGRYPRWSLDGKRIYFIGRIERVGNIWEISLEEGTERPVTDLVGKRGFMQFNTLATDGDYLYFSWGEDLGDIWVMDVARE